MTVAAESGFIPTVSWHPRLGAPWALTAVRGEAQVKQVPIKDACLWCPSLDEVNLHTWVLSHKQPSRFAWRKESKGPSHAGLKLMGWDTGRGPWAEEERPWLCKTICHQPNHLHMSPMSKQCGDTVPTPCLSGEKIARWTEVGRLPSGCAFISSHSSTTQNLGSCWPRLCARLLHDESFVSVTRSCPVPHGHTGHSTY